MIKFRHAFFAIAAVLTVHVFAVGLGWYQSLGWLDIPMHFFGGYAIAILALATYNWILSQISISIRSSKSSPYARLLLEGVFVVGAVMIVGVAWEWYEFIFDQFATSMVAKYGFAQMGLPDTMDDLLNDTLGALTAWYLWRDNS